MIVQYVILDLDSTLVHSRPVSIMPPVREDARNFCVRPLSEEVVYRTTLRKHVEEFLDALEAEGYRVIVWSAGAPPYVKDIVSVIFRERQLFYLFTCDNLVNGLKDLNVIKVFIPDFDPEQARLVDDNPDHARGQEKSFILVPPFVIAGDDPTPEEDDDLLSTLAEDIIRSFK